MGSDESVVSDAASDLRDMPNEAGYRNGSHYSPIRAAGFGIRRVEHAGIMRGLSPRKDQT